MWFLQSWWSSFCMTNCFAHTCVYHDVDFSQGGLWIGFGAVAKGTKRLRSCLLISACFLSSDGVVARNKRIRYFGAILQTLYTVAQSLRNGHLFYNASIKGIMWTPTSSALDSILWVKVMTAASFVCSHHYLSQNKLQQYETHLRFQLRILLHSNCKLLWRFQSYLLFYTTR